MPLTVTGLEVSYEVVDVLGLDVAPSASEASNQLRRPPNSSDEVFRSFGVEIRSATRI